MAAPNTDEFGLIARYFAPLARAFPGSFSLLDDAALIEPPAGKHLVITKDALVEGVHFFGSEEPGLIARKGLRTNLSDLAAMGAEAYGYLLALHLPATKDEAWIAAFAAGLAQDQAEFSISLMGGDTVSTAGPFSFSITALGLVKPGQLLRRAGAQPGDAIFVSGTLGDAALGLRILQKQVTHELPQALRDALAGRYFLPQPRLALGAALAGLATSAMDISDGLMQDVGHLGRASGCDAVIHLPALPLSEAARALMPLQQKTVEQAALSGGDDYELLFTAPAGMEAKLHALAHKAGVVIARIGECKAGDGHVTVLDAQSQPVQVDKPGFQHR